MKAQFVKNTTTNSNEARRNRLEKVTEFGYSTVFAVLAVTIGAFFALWFLTHTLLEITWSHTDAILNSGICESAIFSIPVFVCVSVIFALFVLLGKIEKLDDSRLFTTTAGIYKLTAILYSITFAVVTVWKNWGWIEANDIVNLQIFSSDALIYCLLGVALFGAALFYVLSYAPHELELMNDASTEVDEDKHIAVSMKNFAQKHKFMLWGFLAYAIVSLVAMIVIIENYEVIPDFLYNDLVFAILAAPIAICVLSAFFYAVVYAHYETTKADTVFWNAHCAVYDWNHFVPQKYSSVHTEIKELLGSHPQEERFFICERAHEIIAEYGDNGYYSRRALAKCKKAMKKIKAVTTTVA